MWAVMGWSAEFYQQNRHRALGFSSLDDFIVNFMSAYFSVMDPNNLLCMAWKWQRGDVSRHTGGDLRAALGRIRAKTFVMPMSSDMFFPPADGQAEWRPVPDAEFRPIQTIDGHLALFGADPGAIGQIDRHLGALLAIEVQPGRSHRQPKGTQFLFKLPRKNSCSKLELPRASSVAVFPLVS
jgi:homoserine O-acetyltransferase